MTDLEATESAYAKAEEYEQQMIAELRNAKLRYYEAVDLTRDSAVKVVAARKSERDRLNLLHHENREEIMNTSMPSD